MGRLAVFLVAAPLMVACGQSTNSVTAVDSVTVDSVTVEPAAAEPETVDVQPASHRTCDIDWKTISTAVEAHFAQYQVDVATIDELVPEMLREAPLGWHLEVDDSGVPAAIADTVGPCAGYDPDATGSAMSEPPPSVSGVPCYEQKLALELASNAVFADTGSRPTSQTPLVTDGLLPYEFDLYDFDGHGNVAPDFDGTCTIPTAGVGEPFSDADPACYVDWFTMVVANQFHLHNTGMPASGAELFAAGYVDRVIDTYDLGRDANIDATGELHCPILFEIEPDEGGSVACDVEFRTIETAIEAYWAHNQVEPATLGDLVPGYIGEAPQGWELVFPTDAAQTITIVALEGGPCGD